MSSYHLRLSFVPLLRFIRYPCFLTCKDLTGDVLYLEVCLSALAPKHKCSCRFVFICLMINKNIIILSRVYRLGVLVATFWPFLWIRFQYKCSRFCEYGQSLCNAILEPVHREHLSPGSLVIHYPVTLTGVGRSQALDGSSPGTLITAHRWALLTLPYTSPI